MESPSALTLKYFWYSLGWLLLSVILYLSLTPHPPQPLNFNGVDKLEHITAYTVLMLWFCQLQLSYRQRLRNAILFIFLGIGVEILQGVGGVRQFEYADMVANSCGVLLGWLLSVCISNSALRAVDSKLAKIVLPRSSKQ